MSASRGTGHGSRSVPRRFTERIEESVCASPARSCSSATRQEKRSIKPSPHIPMITGGSLELSHWSRLSAFMLIQGLCLHASKVIGYGRDILNLFALIVDRQRDIVCLLGQQHIYEIKHAK